MPPAAAADAFAAVLDAIRADLEAARFEKALTQIEAWLGRTELTEDQRVALWLLRSQAHVAYGDLDAAEEDYRALLRLRPAYEPEPSLTPPKALERFRRARETLVGHLSVLLQPADATVFVDGRPARPDGEGRIAALAGERVLRVERFGFDPHEQRVAVRAGQTVTLEVRLFPNARTLVVRTQPAGVALALDGRAAGVSEPAEHLDPGQGELVLEAVPLGEHVFELTKPCYRPIVWSDLVTADLTDLSPKVYRPFVMEPARAVVRLDGVPDGAEIRVDGAPATQPGQAGSLEVCPGTRIIEVRRPARLLWREEIELEADREHTLHVQARPNAILVGVESLPQGWGGSLNILASVPRPRGFEPEVPGAWAALEQPGADLLLAANETAGAGETSPWLYSPWLGEASRFSAGAFPQAPPWLVPTLGFDVVDSPVGGAGRVVRVRPGGPAAQAGVNVGMRLVAVAGRELGASGELPERLRDARGGVRLVFELADGSRRELEVPVAWSPRIGWPVDTPLERAALAGWAAAAGEGEADPLVRATARANLAWLVGRAGRHALEAELWRRTEFPPREGIGPATVAYFLGRALAAAGDEAGARQALRRALDPRATAITDDGPPLAWAAADHLADLGETVSAAGPAGR